MTELLVQVEIDSEGVVWPSEADSDVLFDEPGLRIEVVRSEEVGHGFGLGETVALLVTFGVGIGSNLVADAIQRAVRPVIRRVRIKKHETDGAPKSLEQLIEAERDGEEDDSAG